MQDQAKINRIHEIMNDVFLDLHGIQVCDENSRESKQSAILSLIAVRKIMDNIGMRHTMPKQHIA